MGTIRSRKGTWYIDYTHNGKRVKKALRGVKKRREAQKILDTVMGDIARERHKIPRKKIRRTFEAVAREWLEKYCQAKLAESTYRRNKSVMNVHFIPSWGEMDITQLTTKHIEDRAAVMSRDLKPSAVIRSLSPLSVMLECAVAWDYISENPIVKVTRPKMNEQTFDYLVQTEVHDLLSVCEGDIYDFVAIAVHTGMRKGEILGLRMNHINIERRVLTLGKTKSKRVRYIQIHSDILPIFKSFTEDPLFPKSDSYYAYWLKKALKKAGLRNIRLHDLRHTFASNFIMAGGNILVLRNILGHKDLKQTLRYAHLAPDFIDGEIEKISFRPTLVPLREEERDK